MKKVATARKKIVSSEVVHPSSTEVVGVVTPATPTAASATVTAAPAVTVVTTMADAAVQECNALLNQVLTKVGNQEPLNVDQIRRSTKMRKGGAEVIPKILALCQEHGICSPNSRLHEWTHRSPRAPMPRASSGKSASMRRQSFGPE